MYEFNTDKRMLIFKLIAIILHIGNIQFEESYDHKNLECNKNLECL